MKQTLKQQFLHPADEFTPIPFWFWNNVLDEAEITRQIEDFYNKGVMGFVIHPRMGIPGDIPYLSDKFMHYVSHAVSEAHRLGMLVVLYDEAMYPSGSAHGMVVEGNPEYATRALRMEEYPVTEDDFTVPALSEGEHIVSLQLVLKTEEGLLLTDKTLVFPQKVAASVEKNCGERVSLTSLIHAASLINRELLKVPEISEGTNTLSLLFFIEGFSGGTIRGVHMGEDDGEPNAPVSGDLLNPDAMDKFIRLTYDRYYEVLAPYFGSTIIGMFTDEPDVLGRNHKRGSKPWTHGFLDWWRTHGGAESDLGLLWLEDQDRALQVRRQYEKAVNDRLVMSYYGKISKWCAEHQIALTGHPHKSDEIGFLQYFQIPGQDLVWRWVAPENDKALTGLDTTMAKCSSDAARHSLRRRNSNECFGCCGPDGIGWAFTADDMKWYLDWMFVRGVNLLYPHAFFYSIEGEKRFGERPPDVGPHSIWWQDYRLFSDYIKRMCWLMTDSVNTTEIAVLCEEDFLPWRVVQSLYRNQIEFNYLEESLLLNGSCRTENGRLRIARQSYAVLVVETAGMLTPALSEKLSDFIASGGQLLVWDGEQDTAAMLDAVRADRLLLGRELKLCQAQSGRNEDIRISHVVKEGCDCYLLVNEGEERFEGQVQLPASILNGSCSVPGTEDATAEGKDSPRSLELWYPWTGSCVPAAFQQSEDIVRLPVCLERRESLIIAALPETSENDTAGDSTLQPAAVRCALAASESIRQPLHLTWSVTDAVPSTAVAEAGLAGETHTRGYVLAAAAAHLSQTQGGLPLTSVTEWEGLSTFSGMLQYEAEFHFLREPASEPCDDPVICAEPGCSCVLLHLSQVCEIARLYLNDTLADVKMWAPYVFDITSLVKEGRNTIRLQVLNTQANGIQKLSLPSGLIGPVWAECIRK